MFTAQAAAWHSAELCIWRHIVIEGQERSALILVTGWGDTPLAAAENLFRECANYLQKEEGE